MNPVADAYRRQLLRPFSPIVVQRPHEGPCEPDSRSPDESPQNPQAGDKVLPH